MKSKDKIKLTASKVIPAIAVFGLSGIAVYAATKAFSKASDQLKSAVDLAFDSWNDYR